MVSLVDIGPAKGAVTIRGQQLDVNGITAEDIVEIFLMFPEVRMILSQPGGVERSVITSLLTRFPEAAGLVLAAGTGVELSNKEEAQKQAMAARKNLVIGEQYDVFAKIMELTFPRGPANFLEDVQALLKSAGLAVPGWGPGTTSLGQSSDASKQDAPSETAGNQPQGS
jgi:hypothetical protein